MSSWSVDTDAHPGIVTVTVIGSPDADEIRKLVLAHNAAIDGFHGKPYRIFCDLREMRALSGEAATAFEQAKAYSSTQPNFCGSGVLVESAVVGMQHRRTSVSGGVMDTELISGDSDAIWEHLNSLAI